MISRRSLLASLAGIAGGMFAFGSYAFALEPGHRLVTTRYRIRPAGWPDGMRLTVAVISDIHCSEPQMGLARVAEVVRTANALNPDLTVLLGDYGVGQRIYARPVDPQALGRVLAGLKARLGVYGILGNHDYWGSSLKHWPYTANKIDDLAQKYRDMLATAGATLLENDVRRIGSGAQAFWLIGTGSMIALPLGRRQFTSYADLTGQLPKLTDNAPAILLAHEPDLFPQVPDRIGLTLSGHTHGGQVRLFGYSPITPSDHGNRFAYGHVVERGRNLVVSGGLGTSGLPVRFGVPPEIVFIELG